MASNGSTMSPLLGYLQVKPCPMMIVTKAPVLASNPKRKALSRSQEILFALLDKRFQRYLTSQTKSGPTNGHKPMTCFSTATGKEKVQTCLSVQDHDGNSLRNVKAATGMRPWRCSSQEHKKNEQFSASQSCRLSSLNSTSRNAHALDKMGCAELAEHVVYRAKVRLKRRPKQHVSKLLSPTAMMRTKTSSINKNSGQQLEEKTKSASIKRYTIKGAQERTCKDESQQKNDTVSYQLLQAIQKTNYHLSLEESEEKNGCSPEITIAHTPTWSSLVQTKTIYLSDQHSITPKDTGIPNAPPCTPKSGYSQYYNYIQSMSDIKSQRQLRNRLKELSLRLKQAEVSDRFSDHGQEEKRKRKEETAKLKTKQRAEIYALNAIMQKYEEEKFREFMSGLV